MSRNIAQVYGTNPITVNASTDLMYFGQSPYGITNDAAMLYSNFSAQFSPSTGSTNITTLGTITTGTWHGSIITVPFGGTGNSTFTPYSIICAGTTATGTFQNVVGVGTLNQVLISQGAGALPIWSSVPGVTPAALTKTDDTNVTLTLGGTPNTALLQATSLTLGWTGTLSGTRGGTGVNNGASTFTIGGNFAMSGAFAFTGTLTNTTTVTFPTSGTLATTTQIPTGAALTETNDTNVTLTLGGSPTTALVNAASLTLGWTGQLGLTRGGTNASLTASNGGILYSTASAVAILAGTATAGQLLLSGASTAPTWSTATYPATTTINQLLYSSAANTIAGLTTANNGILVTSSAGAPSILAGPGTTGNHLKSNAAAAPSWTTATFPSTGGASGNVLISDGTNYISSTSLWPNTVGTSGKFLISNGTANGYSTSTIPTSAGATANKVLLSDGTNYVLSTPTFPNASATSGKIIISDGTNWIASTPTYPAAAGTSGNVLTSDGTNWLSSAAAGVTLLTTKGDLFGFSTVNARVPVATGDGKVLQVSSAAGVGLAYSTPTYPSASGSAGTILRSDGTNNVYTTATYPTTTTINQILYSSSASVIAGLATANSSVLVTSAGGVPSLSTSLPSGLTIPGFAASGANSDITSMTGLTGTLQAPTGIKSSAGVNLFSFVYTASAVNYFQFLNNITLNAPAISAIGSDSNITLQLNGKGTGGVYLVGTSTNDNAPTGGVGEVISSIIASASAVSAANLTAINVTSISLTAGDWDVWGNVTIVTPLSGTYSFPGWISSTSATLPDSSLFADPALTTGTLSANTGFCVPQRIFKLSGTTTIYLSAELLGASGTGSICGGLYARRRR